MSGDRKIVTDFHAHTFLRMKKRTWERHKSEGSAPQPDGVRVNASDGKRQAWWYASTLRAWRG